MRFIAFGSLGKPCLVKYFKWLLIVIKGQGLARAHFAYRPDHKGHIRSSKGTENTTLWLWFFSHCSSLLQEKTTYLTALHTHKLSPIAQHRVYQVIPLQSPRSNSNISKEYSMFLRLTASGSLSSDQVKAMQSISCSAYAWQCVISLVLLT